MTKVQIFDRLDEITSDNNFIYVLSAIVLKDFCGTLSELASKNARERLNNKEVKFLMGLWVKNWNKKIETESDELKVLDEVYSLMEQLHYTFIPDLSKMLENPSVSSFDFFNNGLMFQESMFYSGTGAYDYQYTKWVTEKYKYDRDWLYRSKSIKLDKLPGFYHSLKMLQQTKLNKLKFDSENTFREKLLDVFCLTSIQSDFKKAVKDAYEQGLTASNCLKSSNKYQFVLKSQPDFKFDFDIKKSFVVTIVLDDYPAITHQTHILLGKEYEEFPVALNIFDLEIVAN